MSAKTLFLATLLLAMLAISGAAQGESSAPAAHSKSEQQQDRFFGDVRWYTGTHADVDAYVQIGKYALNVWYDNQGLDYLIGIGGGPILKNSENHRVVLAFNVLTDRGPKSHAYRNWFSAVKIHADGSFKGNGYVFKTSVLGDLSKRELARFGIDEAGISRDFAKVKDLNIGAFAMAKVQYRSEYGGITPVDLGGGLSVHIPHTAMRVHGGYLFPVNQPRNYVEEHHQRRQGTTFISLSINFKEDIHKKKH